MFRRGNMQRMNNRRPMRPNAFYRQRFTPYRIPRNRRFRNNNNTGFRRNRNIPNTFQSRTSGPRRFQNFRTPMRDVQIISKTEKWFDVISGTNKYLFKPGDSGVAHLDRLASIYENFQIRALRINYIPASGTQIPGTVTIGLDYSPHNERKAQDINLLDPNRSGPVFSRMTITGDINRIMKNISWLNTVAANSESPRDVPFGLYVDSPSEVAQPGTIWISYQIAFATATSPASETSSAIPIAIASQDIVSDNPITPANVSVTTAETSADFTVESTPILTEIDTITDKGALFETEIKIENEALDVGKDFSIGTAIVSSPEVSYKRLQKGPQAPKITFRYANGDPIPDGSIVPSNKPSLAAVHAGHLEADIFSTLFQILKPLAAPVIGTVTQFLDSLVDKKNLTADFRSKRVKLKTEETDLLDMPVEKYNVFGFSGDTANITIPNLNENSFASLVSTTIVFAGANIKNGRVMLGSYNIMSPDLKWIKSSSMTGSNKLRIVFGNPDDNLASFRNGTAFQFSSHTVPLNQGIGNFEQTFFSAPMDEKAAVQFIQDTDTSTLSDTYAPEDPMSTVPVYHVMNVINNTDETGTKASVGLHVTGKFSSLENSHNYKYAIFEIPVEQLFKTIKTDSAHIPIPVPGAWTQDAYAGLVMINIQFFLSNAAPISASSPKVRSFALTRPSEHQILKSIKAIKLT